MHTWVCACVCVCVCVGRESLLECFDAKIVLCIYIFRERERGREGSL